MTSQVTTGNLPTETVTDTLSTAVTAKSGRPAGEGRPEMFKKVLTWGAVAFLVFIIAYRPSNAASVFRTLGSSLYDVATGIGTFFTNLIA